MNYQILDHLASQSEALDKMEETFTRSFTRALEQTGLRDLKDLLARDSGQQDMGSRTSGDSTGARTDGWCFLAAANETNARLEKAIAAMGRDQAAVAAVPGDPKVQARMIADTRSALQSIGQIGQIQGDTVASIKQAGEELKKLIQNARLANSDIIKSHQGITSQLQRLEKHWDSYREHLESMRNGLSETLDGFQGQMKESLESVHGEIDGLLAQSLTHFSGALKEFDDTVGSLSLLMQDDDKGKKSWLGRK